jgi:hypothetical protein
MVNLSVSWRVVMLLSLRRAVGFAGIARLGLVALPGDAGAVRDR